MSLSKTLQSPEVLQDIKGKSLTEIKKSFLAIADEWYKEHADEEELIQENLASLNLQSDQEMVDAVKAHIAFHYAEKILPHAGTTEEFAKFIDANIDTKEAQELISEAQKSGGVLIATPHFGGVELVVPSISRMKFTANAVLKFSTQNLSDKAHQFVERMASSGEFAPISFIELGKPGSNGALEMAGALRRSEVLFTVFDEETGYSVPAKLFGKTVEGGAGLDKLLKFAGASATAFNVFMIRTGAETFKMQLVKIDLTAENPIQEMYDNLQKILENHLEQWYFLHEEIPFMEE
jgi:lauroyl/myristoyl acyltransferase